MFYRLCLSLLHGACLTFLQRVKVVVKAKVTKALQSFNSVCDSALTLICLSAVKGEAKDLIKRFFTSVKHCESEADWEHLKSLYSSKATESRE